LDKDKQGKNLIACDYAVAGVFATTSRQNGDPFETKTELEDPPDKFNPA